MTTVKHTLPDRPARFRIGIDLGGTKIESILLTDGGKELFRKRVATPTTASDNYKAVLESIRELVTQTLAPVDFPDDYSIGIGIPGTIDIESGRVQNANTTWLAGRYFQADLAQILGRRVAMDNDANCFTLAETIGGAAKGYGVVFGIIMGTGCGGGICINGIIHRGKHGIAGEWGHFSIDPEGETCFCGNVGCIDTKLTGPAISRAYFKFTGQKLSAEEVVRLAGKNDNACRLVFDQFLDDFGRSVGGLISTLDPDAVVIGGGLSNIPELYTTGIEKIQKYAFHEKIKTPILKNHLGDSAGVFGAAWLV